MFAEILTFINRFVICHVYRLWCNICIGKGKSIPATNRSNDIIRCSAVHLARRIRQRKITSAQVVTAFIDRIRQINPLLNCVVDECFQCALQDAAAADQLVKSGEYTEDQIEKQFPFLGVPISTKDHVSVKGLQNTCGVWIRKDIRAVEDCPTIALMRKAGAIPFVVTNVPEFCLAIESNNQVFGRTNNPYDMNRVPGGSSGGEGCLLAASGCPLGIGTDLGGSVRIPAAWNGIFGHKPSRGIVSTEGTFPPMEGKPSDLFCFGPMSRFAEDLLPALRIMSDKHVHKLRLDDEVDLSQIKIYYQKNDRLNLLTSKVEPDIQVAIERAANHFNGICKTQRPQVTKLNYLKENFEVVLAYMTQFDIKLITDGKALNRFLEVLKIILGMSRHTFHTLCVSGLVNGKALKLDHHLAVKEAKLKSEFEAMLGIDAVFICPTQPTVALYHNEPIIRFSNVAYTSIANLLGLPSTAVPMGLNREGLPISVQVIAGRNQDRLCLAVARELERAFGGWVEPGI